MTYNSAYPKITDILEKPAKLPGGLFMSYEW